MSALEKTTESHEFFQEGAKKSKKKPGLEKTAGESDRGHRSLEPIFDREHDALAPDTQAHRGVAVAETAYKKIREVEGVVAPPYSDIHRCPAVRA